jgi:ribulose bisphosphate carboxylase small subunit
MNLVDFSGTFTVHCQLLLMGILTAQETQETRWVRVIGFDPKNNCTLSCLLRHLLDFRYYCFSQERHHHHHHQHQPINGPTAGDLKGILAAQETQETLWVRVIGFDPKKNCTFSCLLRHLLDFRSNYFSQERHHHHHQPINGPTAGDLKEILAAQETQETRWVRVIGFDPKKIAHLVAFYDIYLIFDTTTFRKGVIIISLLISPLLGHRPSLWITHKEKWP